MRGTPSCGATGAALLLLTTLLAAFTHSGLAQCTSNSAYVGFQGDLTEMEHSLSGTVRIIDDCSMEVSGFTYDGNAPAAYWWGAPSTDNGAIRSSGRRIVQQQLEQGYNGETITVTLDSGLTWDDFPVVLVWCEDFFADFGHIELQKVRDAVPASPAATDASPAAEPAAEPAAPAPAAEDELVGLGLANCLALLPNYYNLHWEVQDSQIVIGLEGRVGLGNRWLGFGFSEPNATDVQMPGSDAVVVGTINGECFALDYMLQTRNQCSYAEGSGVCPDAALSRDPSTNQVELLSCQKVGDVLAVTLTRPITGTDAWDRAWPLDGSGFPVWGMGPVSEGSNVSEPVVLYHRLQLPGKSEEEITHAPVGQGYRINLGLDSPAASCEGLLAAAEAAAAAPADAPSGAAEPAPAPRPAVAVLSGVTEFDVIEADSTNYPNPPSWGVSYHINGAESPVLTVVRGTTYTFNVMAGPSHPLYFTDSIVGGGSYYNFANETIYGGGEEAHGTPEAPYALTWTPNATVPDLIYYQCTLHMKIGWEMRVVDA